VDLVADQATKVFAHCVAGWLVVPGVWVEGLAEGTAI
jgi:hypothetical protein